MTRISASRLASGCREMRRLRVLASGHVSSSVLPQSVDNPRSLQGIDLRKHKNIAAACPHTPRQRPRVRLQGTQTNINAKMEAKTFTSLGRRAPSSRTKHGITSRCCAACWPCFAQCEPSSATAPSCECSSQSWFRNTDGGGAQTNVRSLSRLS